MIWHEEMCGQGSTLLFVRGSIDSTRVRFQRRNRGAGETYTNRNMPQFAAARSGLQLYVAQCAFEESQAVVSYQSTQIKSC
jgi:hypothetical protein